MKKRIISLGLIALYLVLLVNCTSQKQELRLRIVASSNSQADQNFKLEVKDYLKNYFLINSLEKLDLNLLEKTLNEQFMPHTISVKRCKVNYEAKAYQGKMIQAGYYDTILITLDDGKGKNFWTLLYPEFFNISFEDDHEIKYRSYFYDLFHN